MPIAPPMKRKPTVSSKRGCATIRPQTATTWVITAEATVPSWVSRDSIAVGLEVQSTPFRSDQPRDKRRPKMPTAPPMKRKPTVSRSSGWPTMVVQMVPTWVITAVATDARSDNRVLMVVVRSFLSDKLELAIYLNNLAEEPER